jgi:hypothetical protein
VAVEIQELEVVPAPPASEATASTPVPRPASDAALLAELQRAARLNASRDLRLHAD